MPERAEGALLDTSLREHDACPQAGCVEPLVWCDCEEAKPDGHLICLGCGADAGDGWCDCGDILGRATLRVLAQAWSGHIGPEVDA